MSHISICFDLYSFFGKKIKQTPPKKEKDLCHQIGNHTTIKKYFQAEQEKAPGLLYLY